MKEIRTIISKFESIKDSGIKMALAIVINVEHSSYRRSGARMLITEDGNWVGGISGGCLEGDTLQKAMYAIHKNKVVKVTYDTREDDPSQLGVGLGCNGLIDVIIIPISHSKDNPISILSTITNRRTPSILITNLEDGKTIDYTFSKDNSLQHIEREITNVKNLQRSKKIDGYFIEFLAPQINTFIFGKNYDVIPLLEIARAIGYKNYIVANPIKVSKEVYKLADHIITPNQSELPIDNYSIALLMSHDYKSDMANLIKLQSFNLKYIGLLGPKKRRDKMITEIESAGITIRKDNLYGPMGLDTGATTPEEIAISVLAEIRSCLMGRKGGNLRERKESIHLD